MSSPVFACLGVIFCVLLVFAAGAASALYLTCGYGPRQPQRQFRLTMGEPLRCGTCNHTRAYSGGSPKCAKCGNMTWTFDDLPTG